MFLVELLVAKDVRDHRRVTRAKQTTQEWRDRVDLAAPADLTIRQAVADYRYVGVDTTRLDVAETVRQVKAAIPEIYPAGGLGSVSWIDDAVDLAVAHVVTS